MIIMKTKKRLIVFVLSGMGLIAGVTACSGTDSKERQSTEKPVMVVTALPESNHLSSIEVSGKVESVQIANISTRMMGFITRINVKVGDRVTQGQLLATIESQDIMAKRAQAQAMITESEAALSNAEKDYDRYSQLYNQQSASTKELENMKLQYTSAKSRVEAARQLRNEASAMLSYTQLRAPFAGTVTQKMADAGSMASPGMPILTVEQNGRFQVRAIVPESEIGKIVQGQSVTVTIKSTNKTFSAKIDELSTSSLYTGGQYLMLVNVPDGQRQGLYSGQYANVLLSTTAAIPTAEEAKVLIPESSIIRKDQLTGVYTISQNGKALLRWVRLGKTYGSKVEILSGLAHNEKFVLQADSKLYNGVAVRVK